MNKKIEMFPAAAAATAKDFVWNDEISGFVYLHKHSMGMNFWIAENAATHFQSEMKCVFFG